MTPCTACDGTGLIYVSGWLWWKQFSQCFVCHGTGRSHAAYIPDDHVSWADDRIAACEAELREQQQREQAGSALRDALIQPAGSLHTVCVNRTAEALCRIDLLLKAIQHSRAEVNRWGADGAWTLDDIERLARDVQLALRTDTYAQASVTITPATVDEFVALSNC